jgi:hypothetical protein
MTLMPEPVITATFKLLRAPALHADHDPALECEPVPTTTGHRTCQLVEHVTAVSPEAIGG